MFEASLLSGRRGRDARMVRWIAVASITMQAAVIAALIVVPLLYPDTMSTIAHPPRLTHIELVRLTPKPVPIKPVTAHTAPATTIAAPSHTAPQVEARQGGRVTTTAPTSSEEAPLLALGGGNQMGPGFNPNAGFGAPAGSGDGPSVVAAKPAPLTPATPVRISSGVSSGMLLSPMLPHYPAIAIAARVQGVVIVTATIDRTGHIINAQVTDGPLMLRDAALSAVRDARYRPYLLNGQPTEAVTTVAVNFRMSV